jgi:pimeloyl-ACP methyl ester carboxylesterase
VQRTGILTIQETSFPQLNFSIFFTFGKHYHLKNQQTMAKLYALLVGINEYHPKSGVRNLRGCVNDINSMEEYLKESYPHLISDPKKQIKKILNKEATRENLITTFQDHLGQAKGGDIALFCYSGHGSFEPTAEEFEGLDVKRQNETLVCYDSRLADKQDLADKELAVMLSRLDEEAQKVVILDSCHSGSATRSTEDEAFGMKRQEPARRFGGSGVYKRPLSTYMLPGDEYYVKQKQKLGAVNIPSSRHILLSGCDRDQTALETRDGRGLFSKHLLEVLKFSKGEVSYNDLFTQIRASVLHDRNDQTPKVEPFEGFNAGVKFLGFEPVNPSFYTVTWNAAKQYWEVAVGAVHGLPTEGTDIAAIQVKLYPDKGGALTRSVGLDAAISEVRMEKSVLSVKGADPAVKYKAEIVGLPATMAMRVYLKGTAELVKKFDNLYRKHKSAYLEFTETPKGADYELRLSNKELRIYHIPSGGFVIGAEGMDDWAVGEMIKALNQVEKWERIRKLHKRASQLVEKQVEFHCRQTDPARKVIHEFTSDNVTLELDRKGDKWDVAGLQLTAKNKSKTNLYVTLFYMNRFFEIKFIKQSLLPANSQEEELFFNGLTIGDPNLTEVVDTFKIFASTEEINPGAFTQGKIELGKILTKAKDMTRDFVEGWGAAPIVDWFTKTVTVTISGNLKQVGKEEASVNGITIGGHSKLKAKVSFGPVKSYNRSVSDINKLPDILRGSGLEFMDFSQERSDIDKSVIVLSDIQGEESLAKDPLQISLDQPLRKGEAILPVTFDGEFILPFGEVRLDKKNRPTISIDRLPAEPDEQRRSVGKALKFVVLKTALGENANVFLLRRVDYSVAEGEKRTELDVAAAVAKAKKVLVLVHGIIGDTKEMADEAKFAIEEKGFDLVLTFDYENLSTPIDKIAEAFNKKLEEAGFGPDDGKELHIVAHSMGGLVSRYMIENLRGGDKMVDRLVMFGTPNGGSKFGQLPNALGSMKYLLGFALNFLPGHVKEVLGKLKDLLEPHAPDVFITLKMMDTGSDFIKGLAENPAPSTEYLVVAGDTSNYAAKNDEGKWFTRLMDKLQVTVGKLVYLGKSNDIAVSTDDIRKMPFLKPEHAKVVSCHHLNYFVNPNSVAAWKEFV